MGTHYFTAGYFNPILFTSAISHQIPFSHSEGSFSEREGHTIHSIYIEKLGACCIGVKVLYYYRRTRKSVMKTILLVYV